MLNLWSSLTEKLQNEVNTFGLCDLETDVFFQLFEDSTIKPKSFQVNLKSCCVVPPKLQEFSKEKGVKLHTHADPPSVLGQTLLNRWTSQLDLGSTTGCLERIVSTFST